MRVGLVQAEYRGLANWGGVSLETVIGRQEYLLQRSFKLLWAIERYCRCSYCWELADS
jgi:hypothetical protein